MMPGDNFANRPEVSKKVIEGRGLGLASCGGMPHHENRVVAGVASSNGLVFVGGSAR